MTIPRRSQIASGENNAATQVTLLADLPYLGAAAIASDFLNSPAARASQTLKSSHPAFAELNAGPAVAAIPPGPRQTRFVDPPHGEYVEERTVVHGRMPEDNAARFQQRDLRASNRVPHNSPHTRLARQQLGWRPLLSEVHTFLAPLAGVIVTGALMASAVFLFWIMLEQRQPPAQFDELALPTNEFDVQLSELSHLSADSQESPRTAEIHSAAETVSSENDEKLPGKTYPQQTPTSMQTSSETVDHSEDIPAELAEQIAQSTPPLGELSFPVTKTPLALDYSKALDNTVEALQTLPAVAERADTAIVEPINR